MGCLDLWIRTATAVDTKLVSSSERLGRSVAARPWTYIFGALLATVVLASGLLVRSTVETKGEKLWVPQDSQAFDDRRAIEAVPAFSKPPREESIAIVAPAGAAAPGVLTVEDTRLLFSVWEAVQEVETAAGVRLADVCVRPLLPGGGRGDCVITQSPLAIWGGNRTLFEQQVGGSEDALLAAIEADRLSDPDSVYGLLERAPDGSYVTARAVQLKFYVDDTNDALSKSWELAAIDMLLDVRARRESDAGFELPDDRSMEIFLWRSPDDELERATQGDIPLFVASIVAMIVFVSFATGRWSGPCPRPRVGLALSGLFCVLGGFFASLGLLSAAGDVPISSLNSISIFVLIGVGFDDAFVVLAAWDRAGKAGVATADRLETTLGTSATAITVTTLTNVAAFSLGSLSNIPAVRFFAGYTALAILFTYALYLTFFAGILAVMDRRRVAAEGGATSSSAGIELAGRRSAPAEDGRGAKAGTVADVGKAAAADSAPAPAATEDAEEDAEETLGDRIFRSYAQTLLKQPVRLAVLAFTLAALAASGYAVSQLEVRFVLSEATPDDSYVRAFEALRDDVYPDGLMTIGTHALGDELEHASPEVQSATLALWTDVQRGDFVIRPGPCWLVAYREFYRSSAAYNGSLDAAGYLDDPALFYAGLGEFLATPGGINFRGDLQFDDAGAELTATRCFVYGENPVLPDDKLVALDQAQAAAARSELRELGGKGVVLTGVYIFMSLFINLRIASLLSVILVVCACVIVCSFLLIHPSATLILAAALASAYLMLAGALVAIGIALSPVSSIQLVMAGGLLIDYLVHITFGFASYEGNGTRRNAVEYSLMHYGPAVSLGCLSTFLGTLPLAFADSSIFRQFFQTFASITSIGFVNALVILPVMLSFVGPMFNRDEHRPARPADSGAAKQAEADATAKAGAADEQAAGTVDVL